MSSLRLLSTKPNGILALSFNQDGSCIAVADMQGVRIYNIDQHALVYQQNLGSIRLAEMLFCTSLLAFVGAGEQPALSPRKLTLLNTANRSVIHEFSVPHAIHSVLMNLKRLVVVMDRVANVYDIDTLARLEAIDTAHNPHGVGAISGTRSGPSWLALPARDTVGGVRVYDMHLPQAVVQAELRAHKTPLQLLAWNGDCSLLASCSTKGTVVRVHSVRSVDTLFSFRRGTQPGTITSIAFTPPGGGAPPLLAVASERGTIHLYRLSAPHRSPAATALLNTVVPSFVVDAVEPVRDCATIRLPCRSMASVCAFSGRHTRAEEDMPTDAGNSGYKLSVATLQGILYDYWVADEGGAPVCCLEGESFVTGRQ